METGDNSCVHMPAPLMQNFVENFLSQYNGLGIDCGQCRTVHKPCVFVTNL